MATYSDEEQARADGFVIEHQPERRRFALQRGDEVVGEARYTLLGDDAIDFDGTFVTPALRGTGLSALLARHAVTDEIVTGRRMQASCWYIEEFLAKHPELAR